MKAFMGIDIGSYYSKGVIMTSSDVSHAIVLPSGGDYAKTALSIRKGLLSKASLRGDTAVVTVATGLGAKMVSFADKTRTDISCESWFFSRKYPSIRTVVDVGDLHSKAFRNDESGNMVRFIMSSKCAGGSARVLKVIARVLHVSLEDLGRLSFASRDRVQFSTGCAVFAESEAISRIAEGIRKEDLIAGIHRSLASQLVSLTERVGLSGDLALIGGGAMDRGLVEAVRELVRCNLVVPPDPVLIAASGAALVASCLQTP